MDLMQIPVSEMIGATLISEAEKVPFSSCDMQNHMNATKFMQTALDHRYETVDRILGISFDALKSTKSSFVLGHMKAAYKRPLRPHQTFYSVNWTSHQTEISTWVRSILFSRRKLRHIIHATFEFEITQVNAHGRATPILSMPSEKNSQELQSILKGLENSDHFCQNQFGKSEKMIFQMS